MKTTKILTVALVGLSLGLGAIAQTRDPSPSPTTKPAASATPASKTSPSPSPVSRPSPGDLASPSEEPKPTVAATPVAGGGSIPNPILYLLTQESYTAGGKNWVRCRYDVLNKASYPLEMFAAAPGLPPCGANTNSSRTWVDFFKQDGTRIYGFCALGKPDDLGKIWFAFEEGTIPPSYVYIELNDRQTNTKYKSNLADTTL
jgi:hypothetical protein